MGRMNFGSVKAPIKSPTKAQEVTPLATMIVQPEPTSSVIEVIKEVIIEKLVEVPVYIDRVVEKVVEKPVVLNRVEYQEIKVPYEVIKEVVVEKIVEVRVEVPTIHEVTRVSYQDREIVRNSQWLLVALAIESLVVLGLMIKQLL